MNFEEHAAKAFVLKPAGIPVPRAVLCRSAGEAADAVRAIGPAVVKAQVLTSFTRLKPRDASRCAPRCRLSRAAAGPGRTGPPGAGFPL